MLQTLYRIPLDGPWPITGNLSVPGFGWIGVPMVLWLLFGGWWLFRNRREIGLRGEMLAPVVIWVAVATCIAMLPGWAPGRSIPIYGYGFMLFVGLVVAACSTTPRARSVGLGGEIIWDLSMWIFFAGIAGARLFYVIQYHDRVFAGKQGFLELFWAVINLTDGGLVFYGGMLLATGAYFVFCHFRNVNPLLLADVAVPAVFVGLAFGRIGCFLNGCCYGDRCELPWAVSFPQGSVPFAALVNRGFLAPDAAATPLLHPTQIYSSLNALVLAFLTAVYFKYRRRDGAVAALGMLIYPVTRFAIEYLRGDELGKFHTSLTISQWVSIGLFSCGLLYLFWLTKRPATIHRFARCD